MHIPDNERLSFFQGLYERAKSHAPADDIERRYAQYNGDNALDGSTETATYVRNITYEIIESKVDSSIPAPKVSPEVLSEGTTRNAVSVEHLLASIRDRLPYERYNDADERRAYIYGGSVWLAEWDDSITTHDTSGDVSLTLIHPRDFFPQPGVYDVSDMEYAFVRYTTTKEDLCRRYDVSMEQLEEAAVDAGSVVSDDDSIVTLIVCYYRDDDNVIGRYAFSGDCELEDISDYYARRARYCRKCRKRESLCTCDKPDIYDAPEEYEELDHDITLIDGKVIPAMSAVINDDGTPKMQKVLRPVTDEAGNLMLDQNGAPIVQEAEEPVLEPTKIPYYRPKHLPIVVRINIPAEDSALGQSDCDSLRLTQQAINKVESRILQKLIRASVTPVMPDDAEVQANNRVFGQIIKLKPGENKAMYGTIDTTPDISRDLMEAERLYDQAKRIVGITDSYQGQADTTAKSGRAKQVQVQQAAGRLQSTRENKKAAYADLDRVIFEFYLAYADEPRPVAYRDTLGMVQNEQFNRYAFVQYDQATGEWYIDDRYRFSTDLSIMDEDRQTMWETTTGIWQQGAYGTPTDPTAMLMYWRDLEKAHFPNASTKVAYWQQVVSQMQAQEQIQEGVTN